MAVIDSIQTMYNEEVSSAPGSVSQVRESTNVLMQIAKGMGISIFIVGHVTKDGNVAGPRVLEHMVDTVLYFEGDRHASYRILRGVKNRFGSTNEIGVFEMQTEGLVEVKNPSEYMLNGRPEGASGSVVACSMEGTRPILIEIQALVCHSNFGIPRRTAAGCDFNRVNLLMAVLEKRARINLSTSDAYVNIAGGIKMNEPAIDLGITLAVVSSYKDQVIDEKTVVLGGGGGGGAGGRGGEGGGEEKKKAGGGGGFFFFCMNGVEGEGGEDLFLWGKIMRGVFLGGGKKKKEVEERGAGGGEGVFLKIQIKYKICRINYIFLKIRKFEKRC